MTLNAHPALTAARLRFAPNLWDLVAFALLIGAFVLAARGARETLLPLSTVQNTDLSLDPGMLPEYALRTTLRMLAAIVASLLFTLTYGTLAAKSRRAEMVLIPLLDILQSVPVLGFLSFTVVGFMALFPGQVLGVECASVFAIFTSQAWNMTFSFYQSLRTVPKDLDEVARGFRLSGWQRFWRLEVPFAMPGLIWNAMMSMSGGWFFVVASEAISVGDQTVTLPGIGSYVAMAIDHRDLPAIGWAVLAMLLVILAYDQVLFRPLVAWGEKFRNEQSAAQTVSRSWVLSFLHRTRLWRVLIVPIRDGVRFLLQRRLALPALGPALSRRWLSGRRADRLWLALVLVATAWTVWQILDYVSTTLTLADGLEALGLGVITLIRVVALIALASVIWVPIGVWIGLRPRVAETVQPLAQFLAAFPANILFPVAVALIVHFDLNPDIWLSPLMVLGTQWYILFNVIAGASAFPTDLREAASSFGVRDWPWWRRVILPGIFPYYVTGGLTASGGCWNASIVAEVASWGDTTLTAHGIGAYIATATKAGDFPRVVLGIAVMALFVTLFNRLVWRRLYAYAGRRLRFD